MDSGKICFSTFYFNLLTISTIALIIWIFYNYDQLMTRRISKINGQNVNNSSDTIIIKDPTDNISKLDLSDDLMLGELPPTHRDYRKLYDPLKGPTRRYVQYPSYYGSEGLFNNPTKGYYPNYQLMGYINDKTDERKFMKLFGRRIDNEKYEYYTTHHKDRDLKIPISNKNYKELSDGDSIKIPGYTSDKTKDYDTTTVEKCKRQISYGKDKSIKKTCTKCNVKNDRDHQKNFEVHLYDYESPRYIPYLF